MLAICSNEHDVLWVYDSDLEQKWGAIHGTPDGTYVAISAAYSGQPLEVVYFQETVSKKVLIADPKWVGILSYLGAEATHSDGESWILSHYPDFVSPHASRIKLMALQFIESNRSPKFDYGAFATKAQTKYDLNPAQVKTAIAYAQRIYEGCNNNQEFGAKLDAVFTKIKAIDMLHLSAGMGEIDYEVNEMVTSVLGNLISSSAPQPFTEQQRLDAEYFLAA